jgi:hypothetical protein
MFSASIVHAETRATSLLRVYDIKRLIFGMVLLSFHNVLPLHHQETRRRVRLHERLILGATDGILFGRGVPDSLAELKALAGIIQSSIEQIEATVTANSFTFPASDSIFTPETEAPRMHPAIMSAGSLITSAAAQLTALVRPAPMTLFDITMQVMWSVTSPL